MIRLGSFRPKISMGCLVLHTSRILLHMRGEETKQQVAETPQYDVNDMQDIELTGGGGVETHTYHDGVARSAVLKLSDLPGR